MERRKIASVIDSADLRTNATERDMASLCSGATKFGFYAVCVYPYWVRHAKELLKGSGVKVCTVISFPHGMSQVKEEECARAITLGADELDVVMNISAYLSGGEYRKRTLSEMERCSDLAKGRDIVLKVIIEMPLLPNDIVPKLAEDLVLHGIEFVKTATGAQGPTTPEMVKELSALLKGRARIKAAGGVKTLSDAMKMLDAGAHRIGTSSAVEIVREVE
jgi:deoxyribose-phosphate aldolase